ncbi:MAG: 3-deoxy-D-manno-octulosonic acid transferase [Coraliomargarita sp.]
MIWFYRLMFLPGLCIALPYYLLRMWRRGGYRKDFQHRFGHFRRLPKVENGKKRIWLQAVSVGEIFAIGPLIEGLQKHGDVEIVLTTTTSTAYAEALKRYADKVHSIGIFPLDFWLFSRTAWKRIQPDAVILTESELWPEHLRQAHKHEVPAFLVNARMSDKSFERYSKLCTLAAWLFGQLDHIYAATNLDQQRLIALGAAPESTVCTGSIKFDVDFGETLDAEGIQQLRRDLGFNNAEFILLGSSTWPGEEEAVLTAQAKLIEAGIDCRLLLVPRHAERGPELVQLLEKQSLTWHQRSQSSEAPADLKIHLADTTGELTRLTQAADLAFVGKSLEPNDGGQTPIEAAGLGVPVLMGPMMTNFKVLASSLVRNGAARTVQNASELEQVAIELAKDSDARKAMSKAGRKWHSRNKGSSQRIAESILIDLKHEQW